MLDQATLNAIATQWSSSDLQQAHDYYIQTHTPSGSSNPSPDVFLASQLELRIMDILTQILPAQLAATPLVRPEMSAVGTRLATVLSDAEIGMWASQTPPAVTDWQIGDVMDTIKSANFPQVVVSMSLPGGNTAARETLGPTQDQAMQFYIFYLMSYKPSLKRNLETARAAEAIASVMASYQNDCVIGWQKGMVTQINRNATISGANASPVAHAGIVEFSAWRRSPLTPRIAP